MTKLQTETGKARFDRIECAWLLISGHMRKDDDYPTFKANISFLYDNEEIHVAAEWEPQHGPIQIWHRCEEDDEGAHEHYYYDYVNDGPLNWSQLAVDRAQLQSAFANGEYRYIYSVLKEWTENR